MAELKTVITRELEQWEMDIYEAESVERVGELGKRAEAHIHGARTARFYSDNEADAWQGRISQAVSFRTAALGWVGSEK